MKRLVLVLALVLLAGVVFAQDFEYESAIGFGDVGYAFNIHTNGDGAITRVQAINWQLGYTDKRYFDPVSIGQFNLFWGWGTTALLLPWLGVGGDYFINEQLSIGVVGSLGTMYGLTLQYFL